MIEQGKAEPDEKANFGVLLISGKRTHQENYAPWFKADSRCRIVAVADEAGVNSQRAALNREFAEEFEVPYLSDLDEALSRDDVNIVSVCAEPERRARVLARCARAGKHLYIDKPMTPYRDSAAEVVAAVEESGVCSQMYSFVNASWMRRAKATIAAGELGDIRAIHMDCMFAKGPAGTADLRIERRQDRSPERFTFVDSKAEFYAIGVYALGVISWLSEMRVSSIYGHTSNFFFAEHQRNGQEDFGAFLLNLERGVTASVTGGRVGWSSHPGSGVNQLVVLGSKKNLRLDGNAPRVEIYSRNHSWQPPEENPDDPMGFWQSTQDAVGLEPKNTWVPLDAESEDINDVSRFIDRVVQGRNGDIDARAAAHLTDVIVSGYESAATRKIVYIT